MSSLKILQVKTLLSNLKQQHQDAYLKSAANDVYTLHAPAIKRHAETMASCLQFFSKSQRASNFIIDFSNTT
jgi:hypothetical protein